MSAGTLLLVFVALVAIGVARDMRRMYFPRRSSDASGVPNPVNGSGRIARPIPPQSRTAAQERLARSSLRTGSADVTPHGCAGPVTQPSTSTLGGQT